MQIDHGIALAWWCSTLEDLCVLRMTHFPNWYDIMHLVFRVPVALKCKNFYGICAWGSDFPMDNVLLPTLPVPFAKILSK